MTFLSGLFSLFFLLSFGVHVMGCFLFKEVAAVCVIFSFPLFLDWLFCRCHLSFFLICIGPMVGWWSFLLVGLSKPWVVLCRGLLGVLKWRFLCTMGEEVHEMLAKLMFFEVES